MQICEALEYLHTRKPPIIYRDMKPANVMLKPDGNIKIIDFGIAREYKDQSLADTVSLGTKGYAAPEQFGGRGQTDARTDVYCLGVTLYHLLTGQNPCEPPYEIYPIRHWNPQLSAGLEAIIQKCTQLNPADRYQSCAELLYALHHYEEYGATYRARQKRKLNAFIITVAASVLCLIVGFLGMIMRTQTNNADYSQNIIQAEKASTTDEKLKYYSTAVDIKPLVMDAYLGMIDAVKDDASFSVAEEEKIKKNALFLHKFRRCGLMDVNSQYELYLIKQELQSIINELDDVAYGLNHNFSNIGSDKAAACVSKVASNYRTVKRKLNNIDTNKVTDEYAAAHPEAGNGSGGGGSAF